MANHKSAIKKYKRDEKRRMINKMNKTRMRNKIKEFKKTVENGDIEAAKQLFPQVLSVIDKTIHKGTIHRGTGSRYKSRLSQLLNKATAKA